METATFVLILFAIIAYFIPAYIARNTKYSAGITILNLLLGWTILGWIAALIWAVSAPKIETFNYRRSNNDPIVYNYKCENCGYETSYFRQQNIFKCPKCKVEHHYF